MHSEPTSPPTGPSEDRTGAVGPAPADDVLGTLGDLVRTCDGGARALEEEAAGVGAPLRPLCDAVPWRVFASELRRAIRRRGGQGALRTCHDLVEAGS